MARVEGVLESLEDETQRGLQELGGSLRAQVCPLTALFHPTNRTAVYAARVLILGTGLLSSDWPLASDH